jgi:hypothetical protein
MLSETVVTDVMHACKDRKVSICGDDHAKGNLKLTLSTDAFVFQVVSTASCL